MRQWPYERRIQELEDAYKERYRSYSAEWNLNMMSLELEDGGITVDDGIRIHMLAHDAGGSWRPDLFRATREEMSKLPYHERCAQLRIVYVDAEPDRAAEINLNMICLEEHEGGIDATDGIQIHVDGKLLHYQAYYDQHAGYQTYADFLWNKSK